MKGDEREEKKTAWSTEFEGCSEPFIWHDLAMRLSKSNTARA